MEKFAQVHLHISVSTELQNDTTKPHIAVLTSSGYSSYSGVPSPELCTLVSLPIHEES